MYRPACTDDSDRDLWRASHAPMASGFAGVLRRVDERERSGEVLDVKDVGHEPVGRGPAMQLKCRRLEDEGTLVMRVERHLDLVRHRGRRRGDGLRKTGDDR